MSFQKLLHKIHLPAWIVGVLALVLILRIPSFFEPYNYGDETIYLTLGQGIRQGIPLYSGIYDNKPPLLYLVAAVAGNLFWFKAILAFWIMGTIVVFWKLSKSKISTLIFAVFTTIPLLEGNIVNAELFMIGPTILAFYFLLTRKLTPKILFASGALFGIAALFKVPAAFDVPAIVVFWFITQGIGSWKKIFKDTFYLALGFAAPIFLTFVWFFLKGNLTEYVKAAFLQNIGYLSSFRPGDVQKPFLVRNGPLLIRAGLVMSGAILLAVFRKKISKNFVFVCLWLLFSLFAVTLSERPYPHYLIQSIAPISILLGILFTGKNIEQALVVIPLALAFFTPFYFKFWHYPTLPYYVRFIKFATNKIDKQTYFSGFSKTANRNYQIADFLVKSSLPTQRVFMWDPDSPTVYALSRRLPPVKYVADYHVADFSSKKELAAALTKNPPKFIILTSGHPIPELNSLIRTEYLLIVQIDDAQIWSKIDEH